MRDHLARTRDDLTDLTDLTDLSDLTDPLDASGGGCQTISRARAIFHISLIHPLEGDARPSRAQARAIFFT